MLRPALSPARVISRATFRSTVVERLAAHAFHRRLARRSSNLALQLVAALLVSSCPRRHFADCFLHILALKPFLPLAPLIEVALMGLPPAARKKSVSDLHSIAPRRVRVMTALTRGGVCSRKASRVLEATTVFATRAGMRPTPTTPLDYPHCVRPAGAAHRRVPSPTCQELRRPCGTNVAIATSTNCRPRPGTSCRVEAGCSSRVRDRSPTTDR